MACRSPGQENVSKTIPNGPFEVLEDTWYKLTYCFSSYVQQKYCVMSVCCIGLNLISLKLYYAFILVLITQRGCTVHVWCLVDVSPKWSVSLLEVLHHFKICTLACNVIFQHRSQHFAHNSATCMLWTRHFSLRIQQERWQDYLNLLLQFIRCSWLC